jgi:hypothetical protein
MRLLSRATIQGHGGTRYVEGLAGAEGSAGNGSRKEMIVAIAPASFATRSQFLYVLARDHGHRVSKKECTTRVMWLIASKLIRGRRSSEPSGIQRSPGLDLRVELAQVLNVPGVRDIVTLRKL